MSARSEHPDLPRPSAYPTWRRSRSITIPHIPLFERILYYMLAPDFVARVVFELGLGMNYYFLNQQKQWCIYLLFLCEYINQLRTIRRAHFRINFGMMAAFLLFVMLIHGILVGVTWNNKPGKIFTDSVPVLIMICNIIFLSRVPILDGINFQRVRKTVYIYGVVMLFCGIVAVKMGKPSIISLGGSMGNTISLSVILVTIAFAKRLNWTDIWVSTVLVLGSLPTFNRTSILVMAVSFCYLVLPRMIRSPLALYSAAVLIMVGASFTSVIIPDDSPLMRRIEGTINFDPNATTGAIGERQAEVEAIHEHLTQLGPYAHAFGAGAGGTYIVVFSQGQIPENYSHAHYGWALFKLRYGYVGYFYLVLFVMLLVYSMLRNFQKGSIEGVFVGLLALWGFVFVFTYMFQNQLTAGLQFADPPQTARRGRRRLFRRSVPDDVDATAMGVRRGPRSRAVRT